MSMQFYIQASALSFLKDRNTEDENLQDAIESSFPLLTENAILMWNHIPVLLSYKLDYSVGSSNNSN